ncbi:MAG: hypothetical protein C0599_04310 [Salinivirgaceae bacterium]|nr:MAG: hypothetical protein C0599_04310 [Salinivirgaceae bacterium]
MRIFLFWITIIFLFVACSGEKKSDQLKKEIQLKEAVQKDANQLEVSSKMVYRVPTPIEFYMFFKNAGGEFNQQKLLAVENMNKYLSSKEKAIAFGMYASDLAYSAVYSQSQNTVSYFETGKKLADDLGITEGYGEDLMNRFKANLNNVDSLYDLTADSYWNVFNYLEDQDKTILLSYITVAGWIESLYQAFNAIEKYEENELVHCIADQQYVVENLHAFINEVHKDKMQEDDVFLMVVDLVKAYELLYYNDENVVMTEEQFKSIKEVVVKSRNLLVK